MAGSFRDLKIWKEGFELLMELYRLAERFPPEEKFGLKSQVLNAGNGTIANIAEAHGRYYFADKSRVLYQARGEVEETRSHLSVAHGRGYITKGEFEEMDKRYEGLAKGISSYIGSLRNRKKAN